MASSTKPNPIPDSYRRVTPCLVVHDGANALGFCAAHTEIAIGDSVEIAEEQSSEFGTEAPPAERLAGSLYVEDVDDVVAQAVKLDARLQRPPQDQFCGDRDGCIIDPFGHGWTISTHAEDVEPSEMPRWMSETQGV
jgi:PhnB protein